MKTIAWTTLIGLITAIVAGAIYGYFDDSETAPIVAPVWIACIGACLFAPFGLMAGAGVGFLLAALKAGGAGSDKR